LQRILLLFAGRQRASTGTNKPLFLEELNSGAHAGAQFVPNIDTSVQQTSFGGPRDAKKNFNIATAGATGSVKVWSSLSGKCIAQEHQRGPFEEGSQLTSLELCKGRSLMSATEDARISFMEVEA
jgi:hypothetical protein